VSLKSAAAALALLIAGCGSDPKPVVVRDESRNILVSVELDGRILDGAGKELGRVYDKSRKAALHQTLHFAAKTEVITDEIERLRNYELSHCGDEMRECKRKQRESETGRHRIALPSSFYIVADNRPGEMWVEADGGAMIEGKSFGFVEGLDGSDEQRRRLIAALLAWGRVPRGRTR
jgi:hypothetical protein